LRILIVEDNPVNQAVVVGMLREQGHTITLAGNGREALKFYHVERPDLILMDVQMPELDGIAATREIRAAEEGRGFHTPIIAMTAYAMRGDSARCLRAGMDTYLSKPFAKELLFNTIAAVAGRDDVAIASASQSRPFSPLTLLKNLDGDTELLERVATLFKKNAPAYLAEMRQAIGRRDGGALQKLAHTLLSSLELLGAYGARDLAKRLETIGQSGNFDEADRVLFELAEETDRICLVCGSSFSATESALSRVPVA
jgi:CheY-like chemotaxis protein